MLPIIGERGPVVNHFATAAPGDLDARDGFVKTHALIVGNPCPVGRGRPAGRRRERMRVCSWLVSFALVLGGVILVSRQAVRTGPNSVRNTAGRRAV